MANKKLHHQGLKKMNEKQFATRGRTYSKKTKDFPYTKKPNKNCGTQALQKINAAEN